MGPVVVAIVGDLTTVVALLPIDCPRTALCFRRQVRGSTRHTGAALGVRTAAVCAHGLCSTSAEAAIRTASLAWAETVRRTDPAEPVILQPLIGEINGTWAPRGADEGGVPVESDGWRRGMIVATVVSLILGLAGIGIGFEAIRTNHHAKAGAVPATSIVYPTGGQSLGGNVVLAAVPLSTSVRAVDFVATGGSLHNTKIATGTASIDGFGSKWNTMTVPNGSYTVTSIGYDASGHSSPSASIIIDVKNY